MFWHVGVSYTSTLLFSMFETFHNKKIFLEQEYLSKHFNIWRFHVKKCRFLAFLEPSKWLLSPYFQMERVLSQQWLLLLSLCCPLCALPSTGFSHTFAFPALRGI